MLTYAHVWDLLDLMPFAEPIKAVDPLIAEDYRYFVLQDKIKDILAWEAARNVLRRYGKQAAACRLELLERRVEMWLLFPSEAGDAKAMYEVEKRKNERLRRIRRKR